MTDLARLDAIAQAELVRKGEVSARELVDQAITRIERLNPTLNAIIHPRFEKARAEAAAPADGPFRGVPFLLKDILGMQAGEPYHMGLRRLKDLGVALPVDSYLTQKIQAAGFVILGRTNVPELGTLCQTESDAYGPCRNPWNPDHSTGGSSGGSACAVAAGLVPAAHANDGGGSIRIPASECGLVGLKPSRGRSSFGPAAGAPVGGMVSDGVVTRSVRDTAAILDVLAGYEPGDATWAPAPSEPFAVSTGGSPGRLRIATTTLPPVPEASVDPLAARAVADAAELLRSLGHEVEEVEPPWQDDAVRELFGVVFSSHIALSIAYSGRVAGREPSAEDMEAMSWAIYSMVGKLGAIQYMGAEVALQAFARRLVAFLEPYDALLTPALAERPLPLGTLDTDAPDPMATFTRSGLFTPFTPIFNASGQPGISLPLYQGEDGLPLGVQLIGRPAGEAQLLSLAAQLEASLPWSQRHPPLADAGFGAGRAGGTH